jgi:hypothetical protein
MSTGGKRLVWAVLGIVGVVAAGITAVHAQQIWAGGYGRTPPRFATPTSFDGTFNFCRIMFQSDHREKQGWSTDYPGADINFSVRLSELTKVQVKMRGEDDGEGGDIPDAVVVRLTDEALFKCPFTFMEDAGTARFSAVEVERLPAGIRLSRQLWTRAVRRGDSPGVARRAVPDRRFDASGSCDVAHDVSGHQLAANGID